MKVQITILLLTLSNLAFSQVLIGENDIPPTNESSILEFSPNDGTATKGIILPVATIDSNFPLTNGTIVMDKDTKTIKVYSNNEWIELTDEGSFDTQKDGSNNDITTARTIYTTDDIGSGVILGNTTSTASGVLVLEDDTKALILPKVVNPHLNIKSPVAGTICYDTTSNSVAIFDGKVWSYWK